MSTITLYNNIFIRQLHNSPHLYSYNTTWKAIWNSTANLTTKPQTKGSNHTYCTDKTNKMQKNMATRNSLLLLGQGRTPRGNSTRFRARTDTEPGPKWQVYSRTLRNAKGSTNENPNQRRQWPILAHTKKLPTLQPKKHKVHETT